MATAAKTTAKTARDLSAEITYLTRALKAPTLRDCVDRLAERARGESWSHEEFLVGCLQREVSARESHGGEGRIRAARFPARKSLEEFDLRPRPRSQRHAALVYRVRRPAASPQTTSAGPPAHLADVRCRRHNSARGPARAFRRT
jgi:DNA replication protein DnaC